MKQKSIIHTFLYLVMIVSLFISSTNTALGNDSPNIIESETTLHFEEKKIPAMLYKIQNEDYVSLAAITNYFGMKVNLDNENNQIIITQDETINKQKEFYDMILEGRHIIQDSPHTMEFYGNKFSIAGLKLVDGYNFVPVSELGDFFGYELLYDKIPNSVVMTDDYFYALDDETFSDYSSYMKKNIVDFTPENLEPLKSIDFENYNIYLLGENHAIGKNTEIKLSFIKYLHENYGVRYIIDESGYCDTILFNLFLETGDTSILEENIESVKGTFSYTKENYDFYKNLYEYNQTLPENERIIIVGIDVQHNWREGLQTIKLLIDENKEKPEPNAAKDVFKIIYQEDSTADEMKAALDIIDENKSEFEQYFGDKYLNFYFGMRSIWQSIEFYKEHDYSVRERFIHENIRDLYTAFDIEKCFGMFGGAHTILDGMMGEDKNLAQYLNTEFAPTRKKVLSIMCMYENSNYMNKSTGEAMPVIPNYGKLINKTLAEAASGEYGICPTDEILFEYGALSEMFQYMLCVKNSPASTPFRKPE